MLTTWKDTVFPSVAKSWFIGCEEHSKDSIPPGQSIHRCAYSNYKQSKPPKLGEPQLSETIHNS